MSIFSKLKQFRKKNKTIGLTPFFSNQGIAFHLPKSNQEEIWQQTNDQWTTHQFITLQMLHEEGLADKTDEGFLIHPDDAVRLDQNTRQILKLPNPFPGSFQMSAKHHTQQQSFQVDLVLIHSNGDIIRNYMLHGPLLQISEDETYLPDPAQWLALSSVKFHQDLKEQDRSEYHNLLVIHHLQEAKAKGADIDLSHFKHLKTVIPDNITVSMDQKCDGSLELIPNFGGIGSPDDIKKRLGQLSPDKSVHSLRVQDTIILLNEKKLEAIHEIVTNRKIPPSQVKQFLSTPSAFLDASLIQLDTGFSLRVKGATHFKHSYFGDTELSDIQWFSVSEDEPLPLLKPNELDRIICDLNSLTMFRTKMNDALTAGSERFEFQKAEIPLEQVNEFELALNQLECSFSSKKDDEDQPDISSIMNKVLDISKNDEFCEFGLPDNFDACLYQGELDFSGYKRQPYPHQLEGIQWILGLSEQSIGAPIEWRDRLGALLADDMGLGKTFMSLIAASEFYKLLVKHNEIKRPVLVVAPLSLLENWKQEVFDTFHESPFRDIVILQSGADLNRFKIKGSSVETRQEVAKNEDDAICDNAIQYSLKVGSEYNSQRLDMDRRLVLATYQTLRDYQFSLCRIDWSLVIFDEAQNIKNPNTLQTRTAKGLKSQFKLLVTGTPVENHLGDFWCLFDTARPGLLGAYQEFLKTFVLPLLKSTPDTIHITRDRVGTALRQSVGGLMLRRTKEDNLKGLPEKFIYVGAPIEEGRREKYDPFLECMMTGEQLDRYESVINKTIAERHLPDMAANMLRGLHHLRDISLHPDLMDGGELPLPTTPDEAYTMILKSAKLIKLFEILNQIRDKNEKGIIFVLNKRLQRFLALTLHTIYAIQVDIINGDTQAVAKNKNTKTRIKIIDQFQIHEGFNVLIMSPIAAGVGLTVTSANHVIHLERHWNPAKEDQATDRVYRIGQTKQVHVYIPITHHPEVPSFEVNLNRLLMKKSDLKDAIVTQDDVTLQEITDSGLFDKEL